MANDYGDFVNGKDTAERIGPKRMVQSGEITPKTMLQGIIIIGIFTAISGLALILVGTAGIDITNILIFGVLGIAAIVAAIKYTVGKNPYGYRGLGDIFVFIFFGLVGVIGTYFLHTQSFSWDLLLPASAMGFLSTGVLNMNNLRDYEADKNANKKTIVVAMGQQKAKYNQQKILTELDKLTENELYIEFQKIKSYVQEKLIEKQKQVEEQSSELASKIEKLN